MTVAPIPIAPQSRFGLRRTATHRDDFGADVRAGLTATQKWLPPRWFYDELGSSLFDAICFLPEYYVMRAESEVLTAHMHDIAREFGTNVRLIELGSGAARKTRILLDALTRRQQDLEYVPVDVDESMLERVGRDLLLAYPRIRVTGVVSDFTRPSVPLAVLPPTTARTVVLFLGSTIGNLDPDEALAMLRDLRQSLQPGDALFLGADLRKDKSILEPAYDDALGVTAAFNLNLLTRMNRELGANFDVTAFRHHAFYDPDLGRIEMHLVSRRAQRVSIAALDLEIAFAEGETIHTENSWKHDDATLASLAAGAGFTIARKWTDARKYFADVLLLAS
jgi:L-histidine N-alpha-methyltransferase